MTKLVLLLTFLFALETYAQESRIENLLGEGFRSIPVVNRGYSDLCKDCKLVFTQRRNADTSGIIYNNNYILFRNYVADPVIAGKSFAYIHEQPVSNAEFQEFQSWVRDSMARERIYVYFEGEKALEYITLETDKSKISLKEHWDVSAQYRERGNLNWNKKFSYSDPELIPILADLYLPQAERFYQKREFDSRKYAYENNEIWIDGRNLENRTALITYPESFALESTSKFSETNALAQLYETQYPEMPVLVFSSAQARAFCQWKQEQLQKDFNSKGLNYKVAVTLPLNSELRSEQTAFVVPAKDYTENWKITVQEYQEFVNAVRDSIVMEQLYEGLQDDIQRSKLLNHSKYYLDESALEMVTFDPSKLKGNRNVFPFQPVSFIYKKNKRQIDSLRSELPESEINFKYWAKDMARMAIIGTPTYYDRGEDHSERLPWDSLGHPIGKTQRYGWYNRLMHVNEALGNENLSLFFYRYAIEHVVPTIPLNQQTATEIVKGISYNQALAYYNWKFPIAKAGSTQNWQEYVFPTKEQFEAVQRGESIIIPEHQLPFPTPTFHYVVHVTSLK